MSFTNALLLAGVTFVGVSAYLTRHPALVHGSRKARIPFTFRNTAHRGGCHEAPENTMHAFRHAVTSNCSVIELDVRITKDGEVVVFHDRNLERRLLSETAPEESLLPPVTKHTTDKKGQRGFHQYGVEDLNYDQLPLLALDAIHTSNPKIAASNDETRRIPLLSQVFETFPNIPIMIDIKSPSLALVEKCADLVRKHDREHITVWGCYYHKRVAEHCRKVNPNIPIFYTAKQILFTYFLYWSCMLSYFPVAGDLFSVPALSIFLSPGLFSHLKARGVTVLIWGRPTECSKINTAEGWEMLYRVGVDGICTDKPEALEEYLKLK